MQSLILFAFGALTGASGFFGWYLFHEPDPSPPTPTALDNAHLHAQLHEEITQRARVERKLTLTGYWLAITRSRLAELGQPQSWPARNVSTVYPVGQEPTEPTEPADVRIPERIPPQNLPTTPREK